MKTASKGRELTHPQTRTQTHRGNWLGELLMRGSVNNQPDQFTRHKDPPHEPCLKQSTLKLFCILLKLHWLFGIIADWLFGQNPINTLSIRIL